MPLMYFALAQTTGYELYRSNVSQQTAAIVRDLCPGTCNGVEGTPVAIGNTVYFIGRSSQGTIGLWRSDGTAAGTQLVSDVGNPSGSAMKGLTRVGNRLFFTARPSDNGSLRWAVYVSDGTAAGTREVRRFPSDFNAEAISAAGNYLFFRTTRNISGDYAFWVTDGSEAGTINISSPLFADGNSLSTAGDDNNTLYFQSDTGRRFIWYPGLGNASEISPASSRGFGFAFGRPVVASCGNQGWFMTPLQMTVQTSPGVPGNGTGTGIRLWSVNSRTNQLTFVRDFAPSYEQQVIANNGNLVFYRVPGISSPTMFSNGSRIIISAPEFSDVPQERARTNIYTMDCRGNYIGFNRYSTTTAPSSLSNAFYAADSNFVYYTVYEGANLNLYATDGVTTRSIDTNVFSSFAFNYTYPGLLAANRGLYSSRKAPNTVSAINFFPSAGGPGQLVSHANSDTSDSNQIGPMTWVDNQPPSLNRVLGDFNGDGRTDILWRNSNDGFVTQWQMNGTQIINAAFIRQVPNEFRIVGTGDFDGDGKTDILWRAPDGNVNMWLMDGMTIKQAAIIRNVPFDYQVRGVGDFDGDGRADILWQGSAGDVNAWLMNGTSILSAGFLANVTGFFSLAGIGDFNADGRADLLWRGADGTIATWQMSGLQAPLPFFINGVGDNWQIQGVRDVTGDRRADIVWRNDDGTVAMWQMNGSTATGVSFGPIDADQTAQGLGDLDGDGRADIVWRSPNGTLRRWNLATGTPAATDFNTVTLDWVVQ